MWRICSEQQHHVGKLKCSVSTFTTCSWVSQPSWNCLLLRVCAWQENASTSTKACCYLYNFLLSCHMIIRLPPPCDFLPPSWPLRSSSLCSSCGCCHRHTGSLPFIVSPGTQEIPSLQVASTVVTPKHSIHTYTCAMLWFMLSAVQTTGKKPKWRRTAACPNLAVCRFIISPGQQLCHTG